jgi:hypothetical protein
VLLKQECSAWLFATWRLSWSDHYKEEPVHVLHFLQALGGLSHMAVWVQLPMVAPAAAAAAAAAEGGSSSSNSSGAYDAAFDCWCQLFTLCEQNSLLGRAAG